MIYIYNSIDTHFINKPFPKPIRFMTKYVLNIHFIGEPIPVLYAVHISYILKPEHLSCSIWTSQQQYLHNTESKKKNINDWVNSNHIPLSHTQLTWPQYIFYKQTRSRNSKLQYITSIWKHETLMQPIYNNDIKSNDNSYPTIKNALEKSIVAMSHDHNL